MSHDDFLQSLRALVGAAHVLGGEQAAPFLVDWRGHFRGAARAVVRPGSTAEVAAVVRCCAAAGVPIVPQGGNTGLCGGATPDASGRAIVLLLTRLDRIREIDTDNDSMTVEAGCLLQTVQQAAQAAGRLFPLSLAAEGSCTIGGNLATNAGGTQVLRYGNMRELCLGLEVVDAEGEVWHGLRALRKDNTGYDQRDHYIGSEGTLGIITAATLKLHPLPAARCTAMLAVPDLESALALLSRARTGFGAALTGFELMSADCLALVTATFRQQRLPFAGEGAQAPWFALLEMSDAESEQHGRERFETVLGAALEAGEALDAVIAESLAHGRALWHLRESITLAQAQAGRSLKHDVALPISRIPQFMRETGARLAERFAGLRVMPFGHLGDGNLHYNLLSGPGFDAEALAARQDEIYACVHDAVHALGGSVSAEHGVGQLKVAEVARYKSAHELRLMARIKAALDPQGLLNPGKVLARPDQADSAAAS
ncbi:FAD-binding oxidoreductase [Sphaerotilus sulfidivorans]